MHVSLSLSTTVSRLCALLILVAACDRGPAVAVSAGDGRPLPVVASDEGACVVNDGHQECSGGGERYYLAACTVFRDEDRFLREWLAFHLCVGVEHFFLYADRPFDDCHVEILQPYLDAGGETRSARIAHTPTRRCNRGVPLNSPLPCEAEVPDKCTVCPHPHPGRRAGHACGGRAGTKPTNTNL
jgi:hypothetical protein